MNASRIKKGDTNTVSETLPFLPLNLLQTNWIEASCQLHFVPCTIRYVENVAITIFPETI
jgi:hypothetical protein